MNDALTLAWRQYRLERRLFWRNPSAAFFNFLLPLLFLAAGGVILHGNQNDLNKLVPSIAGMSVMSTTFTALAYNIVFLRERGVLKRIRGTPLRTIAEAMPLYPLIHSLSGALVKGTSLSTNLSDLGVIAVWAALGIWLALRGFSWEQRRT